MKIRAMYGSCKSKEQQGIQPSVFAKFTRHGRTRRHKVPMCSTMPMLQNQTPRPRPTPSLIGYLSATSHPRLRVHHHKIWGKLEKTTNPMLLPLPLSLLFSHIVPHHSPSRLAECAIDQSRASQNRRKVPRYISVNYAVYQERREGLAILAEIRLGSAYRIPPASLKS